MKKMKRMKIIQVCPRFYPHIGGIETHVYEISKRLAKRHDVSIYTTDPTGKLKKEETKDGIKIFRFKSIAPNEAYFFSSGLYMALRKESADIVHVHSAHSFPSYLAYRAVRNFRKFIFTPHYHPFASSRLRTFLHKIYDPLQSSIFKNSDKVICVSNYEKNLLRKKFGLPRSSLVNIPNGIDVRKFKKKSKRKDDLFSILYVGRLEKYKRVQWILESLKEIVSEFPECKIKLVIVGKGPYEKKLKEMTKKLGLRKFVKFKKNLSDEKLMDEYYQCDVFVMPSEYEAFSITTLEALSAGKPVIVSKVGFLKEISKGNGFAIESQVDLTLALLKVIENGIRVNFNFRKYSWDRIAQETERIYI